MLAAIAGFLPGYLRQHRQHRLPNQSTIPVRPRGWTRSLSIVADAADGAGAVMGSVLSSMAIILIVRMPNRPSRPKTFSMPSVGTKICARRSRPASAGGLFGHNTRSGRSCSQRQSIRCRAHGDPAALRLAFKDLMGSALLRQHRQHSSGNEHVLSLARGRATQLIIWSGLSFAASENVRLHRHRYPQRKQCRQLPTLGEALPH
jgi:hypothetical protein